MAEFTVSVAGVPTRVESIYPEAERFCRDYITEEEPLLTVSVTQEDIERERALSAMEDEREGRPVRRFSEPYLETLAIYRRLAEEMLRYNAVVFHSSALAVGEAAYLFTAPSGTGKTTHTRLWLEQFPDCHVLNGDKPMLRFTEGGVLVCGTPWQGKERLGCNEILPLAGICLLERGEENSIEPISFRDALPALIRQTHCPEGREVLVNILSLLGRLKGSVGLFRLRCNMRPEAAQVCRQGLMGG